MSYDLGAAQRAYDNAQPAEDLDLPQLEIIDEAIAHLQAARRAYNLSQPKFAQAEGFVEEAIQTLQAI